MTLKKVLLNCLLVLALVNCSTESLEENNDLQVKSSTTIITPYYGMPFDNQYLDEELLIKITYQPISEAKKFIIREDFSKKYSDLVLVKVASAKSPVEYWFLRHLEGHSTGGTQYIPEEEEEDPNSTIMNQFNDVIKDIMDHELINLYEDEGSAMGN